MKGFKKKLAKRNNCFHYKDYKYWKKVEDFCINKYGEDRYNHWKEKGLFDEKKYGYLTNMQIVTVSKSGKSVIDTELFSGCYPSSIQTGINEPEPIQISTSFKIDMLTGDKEDE